MDRRKVIVGAASAGLVSTAAPAARQQPGNSYSCDCAPRLDALEAAFGQLETERSVGFALPDNAYLATFQRQFGGTPIIDFYTSLDGKCWSRINECALPRDGNAFVASGSPSITYFNGEWWIAVGNYDSGSRDFVVYKSGDLTTWRRFNCTMGRTAVASKTTPAPGGFAPATEVWAPELFVDQGRLYALVSIRFGDTLPKPSGGRRKYLRQYYTELLANGCDTLAWSEPVVADFGPDNALSMIDWSVTVINGRYWVASKDNVADNIRIYSGFSLRGPFSFQTTIFDNAQVEAPSWSRYYLPKQGSCTVETRYRIYVDNYNPKGELFFYEAASPAGPWSEKQATQVSGSVRHGTIVNMADLGSNQAVMDVLCMSAFGRA